MCEAPKKGHSSVFLGNIAYDCDDDDMRRILRTAGPFRDIKLILSEDNKPKGFGFCTYNDPDTASSALRNLNKSNIKNRELKVSFGKEENSTNIKPLDIRERDQGEIIKSIGTTTLKDVGSFGPTEPLNPHTSTVDEMMRSLTIA
mmetsp:Transcript_23043/g.35637  ORF Transcript_23043/g.35637 Transcript_23043/m.35637 type:complete len:145 (-) Transcript_23043:328-762(-)